MSRKIIKYVYHRRERVCVCQLPEVVHIDCIITYSQEKSWENDNKMELDELKIVKIPAGQ